MILGLEGLGTFPGYLEGANSKYKRFLLTGFLFIQLNRIRTLSWNPAGQLIATGSADRTIRIWNPERPNARYSTELKGHSAGVEKVAFNPVRDAELASCSTDGTVRFWDVRAKSCIGRLDVGGETFTLSWSADGSVVLVGRKVCEKECSKYKYQMGH